MNIFEKHEIFEIEILEKMKSGRVLAPLVFGGGTMLRLCHEMKRYSADLDFWRIRELEENMLFNNIRNFLQKDYEITDAQVKKSIILFEIRSRRYPKRLKIEIRKEIREWDFQEKIAFSRFSNRQVSLKAHTLEQTMVNKIAAFLDRAEVRDGFDIEFLLRQGVSLPDISETDRTRLIERVNSFKPRDFKVTLGSVLESDARTYYIENQFSYLRRRLELQP
jgi:predicted nucleotidyltransferase component of viral defense system